MPTTDTQENDQALNDLPPGMIQPTEPEEPDDSGAKDDGIEEAGTPVKGEGKDGTSNKALQKMQQRQSAQEQTLTGMGSTLNELVALVKNSQSAPSQTTASSKSFDNINDDAEKLAAKFEKEMDGMDDDEMVTAGTLRKFNREYAKLLNRADKSSSSASSEQLSQLAQTVKQLQQQNEQMGQTLQQQQKAQVQAQQYWSQFQEDHGFDGRPQWRQAMKLAKAELGEDDGNLVGYAFHEFKRMVKEKQSSGDKPKKSDTKPSKAPPQSTEGTNTLANGASKATRSKERKFKLYRPSPED